MCPLCPLAPRGAAIILSLALIATPLRAQAPTESDPPKPAPTRPDGPRQTVDKVEVKGKRDATQDRRDSTAAKIIITREDIERYGDSNLGDVMRRLPGVTQGGRPGRGGPVRMRGMAGGFTQILLDGERIPPGFSIAEISPEQVERIEILRAPTAETGARAIAGTINIILREPLQSRQNDVRPSIVADRGRFSPSLSFTRNDKLGETGTYNLTVNTGRNAVLTDTATETRTTRVADGIVTLAQTNMARADDVRDNIFISNRMQWRLGVGEMFSSQPFFVRSRTRSQGVAALSQSVGLAPYARANSVSAGENQVMRSMLMLNRRTDQDTRYELRGGGGRLQSSNSSVLEQRSNQGLTTLRQTTESDAHDRSWNIAGKLSRSWGDGKNAFVVGGELEGVKRTDNAKTFLNGSRQLADFGDEIDVSTARRAIYAQNEWDPNPNWSTYFGLRWEAIETKSNSAATAVSNKSSILTPLAHGVWRFAAPARDQLRLSLTQSYRPPTTQNLVARPSLNTLFPVPGANTAVSPDRAGNPNLKPERANGIDFAYENYLKVGGVVSVNLFTRRITDLIRTVTAQESVSWASSPRFVARPQNLGNAITSGLEFDAKFALPELFESALPINTRANLSLYKSSVDQIPGPNNRISEQPRLTANFGGDYRFRGEPFSIGATLAITPGYETRLTESQTQKLSTRRVWDSYILWNISSTNRLRLTFSNIAPRDSESTNTFVFGNERQDTRSTGRTDMSIALRAEIRL